MTNAGNGPIKRYGVIVFFMTLVEFCVRVFTTIISLVASGLVAFFFIALVYIADTNDNLDKELAEKILGGLWFLFLLPMVSFWHPYYMVNTVIPQLDWFIPFMYWEYVTVTGAMVLVSFMFGAWTYSGD